MISVGLIFSVVAFYVIGRKTNVHQGLRHSHDSSITSATVGSTQNVIQCSFNEYDGSAIFSNEDEATQRNDEWGNVSYRYPIVSSGILLQSAVTAEIVAEIFKLKLDIKVMNCGSPHPSLSPNVEARSSDLYP